MQDMNAGHDQQMVYEGAIRPTSVILVCSLRHIRNLFIDYFNQLISFCSQNCICNCMMYFVFYILCSFESELIVCFTFS